MFPEFVFSRAIWLTWRVWFESSITRCIILFRSFKIDPTFIRRSISRWIWHITSFLTRISGSWNYRLGKSKRKLTTFYQSITYCVYDTETSIQLFLSRPNRWVFLDIILVIILHFPLARDLSLPLTASAQSLSRSSVIEFSSLSSFVSSL